MYSKEIHDAILKAYKSVDAYEAALKRVAEPFVLPMNKQIKIDAKDTTEEIFGRLTALSTDDNSNLWVLGAYRGATMDLETLGKLMMAVEPLGVPITLHLQGEKTVPAGIVHPRYLRLLEEEEPAKKRVKLDPSIATKFPYYEANTPNMVESVMVYDNVAKTWKMMGMVFAPSNFTLLPAPIKIMDAFRLVYIDSFWKMLVVNARITSPEHLIQLLKVAASLSPEYQLTDEAECELSLNARMAQLKELGFEFVLSADGKVNRGSVKWLNNATPADNSFDTYREMNTFLCLELWERIRDGGELTPAMCKKIGNAVGFNAAKYFACMNGEASVSSDYSKMGNNARLMAVGMLLRLHGGDEELAKLLAFCNTHSIRVHELAVHGGVPDVSWGAAPCYPRMSPVAHLTTGTTPAYDALGAGFNAVLDAMRGLAAPQVFLGFLLGNTLETPNDIRQGARGAFYRMLNVLD